MPPDPQPSHEEHPRVLMLGKGWFPDQLGGLDRYFRDLLEHQPEATAVVVGPASGRPDRVVAASHHAAPLPWRLLAFSGAARRAAGEADVVDAHFALYALVPLLLLRRLRALPLVVHFQGPWADENVAQGDASPLRLSARRALERTVYGFPKNLVEVAGLALVERVLDQLTPLLAAGAGLICLVRRDEADRFHTGEMIRLLCPGAHIVTVPDLESGAACAALLAVDLIDPDVPLLVYNGDQIVDADLAAVVAGFRERGLDGGVVVFGAVHPRWSYVRCDDDGYVIEAAEKRPISKFATAGRTTSAVAATSSGRLCR